MNRLTEQSRALVQQLHELLSSTSWFGRTRHDQRVVYLLDQIRNQGEPATIGLAAKCLFESSLQIKIAASQTIHELLSRFSPEQLIQLSGVLGSSWGWYISESWDKLSPQGLVALLVDSQSRVSVLGLLTFHRSGYVRQEAVRLLASDTSGEELPYLLIRQNDWVEVIAIEAQRAVNQRLLPSNLPHFIRFAPLVVRLLSFRRQNVSPVVRKVVEMLVHPARDSMLTEVIEGSHAEVRRQVVQLALELPGQHLARVMRHGLASTDPTIRLACAIQVCMIFSGSELQAATVMFQHDRFMPVRREGFRVETVTDPDSAAKIWRRALLDSSASIRELARYTLGKVEDFDAGAFYRHYLAENGVSYVAVSGLAETGDQTDVATLRSLLNHPRPRFRCMAIRGIARIAKDDASGDLVRSLWDSSPRVVREAKTQLKPFVNNIAGETLFEIVSQSGVESSRRCVLQLIFEKGKWQSLPWLIRIACLDDDSLATKARHLVEEWFSPPLCNKVFTKPNASERRAIDAAIEASRRKPEDKFLERVQECLEPV